MNKVRTHLHFLFLGIFALFSSGCFYGDWIRIKLQNSLVVNANFDQTTFYKGISNPNSVELSGVCYNVLRIQFTVANLDGGSTDCIFPTGSTEGTWSKSFDISGLPEGSITIKIIDPDTNSEYASISGQKDLTIQTPTFDSSISSNSSFANSPTFTLKLTNLEVGSTINFYTDNCGVVFTTRVASTTTEEFTLTVPAYGTYPFVVKQIDRANNASLCSSAVFSDYTYSYAKVFNVTSAAVVSNPDAVIDGVCADAGGLCSFRAALNEASADQTNPYIFNFETGTYSYNACTDFFTTNRYIKFVGAGPALTIFDGDSTNPALCSGGGFFRLHLKDIQFREFNGQLFDIFTNSGFLNYEIDNVEFRNNIAGTYGVISFRTSSQNIMKNSLFEGNSGSSAIYSWVGNGVIDNSRFINNTTTYGIQVRNSGVFTISNTTVSGGVTGIYNNRGLVLNLQNVTVSGNSTTGANLWAGTYNVTVNISNSTFYKNGTVSNGNLYIDGGTGGHLLTVNSYNSIFAINNLKTNCTGFANSYLMNYTNSLLDEASCGAGVGNIVGVDPLLGALSNNGGASFTHLPSPVSPVIDAGENNYCMATDQRGLPRPVQKITGTPICDIGAVEVQ